MSRGAIDFYGRLHQITAVYATQFREAVAIQRHLSYTRPKAKSPGVKGRIVGGIFKINVMFFGVGVSYYLPIEAPHILHSYILDV